MESTRGPLRPVTVVVLRGPLPPARVRLLAEQLEPLLAESGSGLLCDVREPVDVGLLGLLARLELTARRHGAQLRLVRATTEATTAYEQLAALTGLRAVLPRLQPGGQAEPLEQRGVQEVVDVREPPG